LGPALPARGLFVKVTVLIMTNLTLERQPVHERSRRLHSPGRTVGYGRCGFNVIKALLQTRLRLLDFNILFLQPFNALFKLFCFFAIRCLVFTNAGPRYWRGACPLISAKLLGDAPEMGKE